jgi:hypothetical protein
MDVLVLIGRILMHGFWRESDAQAKQTEQVHFFKDAM